MNLSSRSLALKFGAPERTRAGLLHLQEGGRDVANLSYDGWVAGGTSPPSDPGDITDVPTARDLPGADDYQARVIAFLRDQQSIYRQAIAHIDDYLANVQRGKVNRDGVTSGPRSVNTNDKSSHPGSRVIYSALPS